MRQPKAVRSTTVAMRMSRGRMKRSGTPKIFLSVLWTAPPTPPFSPRLRAAGRGRETPAWPDLACDGAANRPASL